MAEFEDGTGKGFSAKVNSAHRVYTQSESLGGGVIASLNQQLWSIVTADVTLTTDSESAIFYLKYNGSKSLLISLLASTIGSSTGDTEPSTTDLITNRNPTGGSIVDNAIPAIVAARNFSGNEAALIADRFQGVEGDTLTGGDQSLGTFRYSTGSGLNRNDANQNPYTLQSGNSFGVSVLPPSGNTEMVVRFFAMVYEVILE